MHKAHGLSHVFNYRQRWTNRPPPQNTHPFFPNYDRAKLMAIPINVMAFPVTWRGQLLGVATPWWRWHRVKTWPGKWRGPALAWAFSQGKLAQRDPNQEQKGFGVAGWVCPSISSMFHQQIQVSTFGANQHSINFMNSKASGNLKDLLHPLFLTLEPPNYLEIKETQKARAEHDRDMSASFLKILYLE